MPPEVTPGHIIILARAFQNVKVVEALTLKKLGTVVAGAGVLAASPEMSRRHTIERGRTAVMV